MKEYILFLVLLLNSSVFASITFRESGDLDTTTYHWAIHIYDGEVEQTVVNFMKCKAKTTNTYDSSILNIVGKDVEIEMIWMYNNSTVNIREGNITKFCTTRNSSTLNIDGGDIAGLASHNSSVINIKGKNRQDFWLQAYDNSNINVYGYDMYKRRTGGKWGYGFIAGRWRDQTPFHLDMWHTDTYDRVNACFIPEPVTSALLGIGCMILLRRRRKRQLRQLVQRC